MAANFTSAQKPQEPLNILFVSHDAYPHGAQNLLLNLAIWLKETGLVNPRFVLAGPGSLTEEFLRVGPALIFDADHHRGHSPETTLRMFRSFAGNDLSAVYLNSAASGHLIETTRKLGVPQIVHVHELEKSIEKWVGSEKMAAIRSHATLLIAASAPVADNLHERHRIPREKLRVVDAFIRSTGIRPITGAEKRECKSALSINPDSKVVLGCGTTDWRKGPDLFVRVAKAVRDSYPGPLQFVWVGGETQSGEINQLKRLVESLGIEKEVRFVGEVASPLPFILAADIFLLSSREDPFPLVCLESGDCGIPIVCFADAGGMPGFVGSSCGVVVPSLDVDQMGGAVQSLLTDDERRIQLGEQARAKVRSQVDVSVKGKEIFEILQSVCVRTHYEASANSA